MPHAVRLNNSFQSFGYTNLRSRIFDRDEKQKLRWFEVNAEAEAKEKAEETYGRIQIIQVYVSNRTLKEIMELD